MWHVGDIGGGDRHLIAEDNILVILSTIGGDPMDTFKSFFCANGSVPDLHLRLVTKDINVENTDPVEVVGVVPGRAFTA